MNKFLVFGGVFCFNALIAIGGGLTYHFVQNPGDKLIAPSISYVLAHATYDGTTGTDSQELYKDNSSVKDYKCVVTSSNTGSQQVETDEDCKVYSVDSNDDSSISLKSPASEKEIKEKNNIKKDEEGKQRAALYQISLKSEVLKKFKQSDESSNFEIKLVPKSTTYSSNDSKKYITFRAYLSFGTSGITSTQGQVRNVVVKILSEKHDCGSEHKDFKLGEKSGYHFFTLTNSGSSSAQESEIKNQHFSGLSINNQAKCTELEKDKFYLLNSPADQPFDVNKYRQTMEFSCDNCEHKIQTQVIGFLVSRTSSTHTPQVSE